MSTAVSVVDYLGYRLIATSKVPISKDTLVIGSNNGGVTIESNNDKLNEILKEAAAILGIKPHLCYPKKGEPKTMYSACDIEGHIGTDGKFYLVDFSR